jgi:osomolarity two-component system, sensor histidine kinase TcsA
VNPNKAEPPSSGPSEQRLGQMFSALSPIPALLLDSSFTILQASSSYLALNRLTSDLYRGRNVYEFIQTMNLVPNATALKYVVDTAIATRSVYATEDRGTARSHWHLRVVPIFDKGGLVYVTVEVQNVMTKHPGFQAVNNQDIDDTYRILVETVKDYAIFMLDTSGNVKTWNVGAALLKGYKPEEIIGRHFSVFYGEEDIISEKPRKELEICLREGKVEDESWRYRKDGSRFWANVIITSVYRNGTHIGFSKVTRDLTERKAAESRLISAYEESAKLKSAFLANMSHEMRTPLHGMLSALTLLMDSALTPEQKELGHIMEESGSVLLQVINDILDYTKLASGAFSISSDVIHIPDIISSVVRGLHTAINPSVCFRTSVNPSVPKSARGDPLRYRQIVQNLLANAVKFTESGSIHIHVSLKHEDGVSYTILTEVTDTGIGMPESAASSMFMPFTQFDTSATKRYQGTGLGLSICKSLAQLMGGVIGFHPNTDSHGSTFWFTVKVEKLSEPKGLDGNVDDTEHRTPLDPLAETRGIAPEKRLLAEDNIINLRVMLMMLKSLGFERVDTAANGADAIQLVKERPLHYDLILMDINMPGARCQRHRKWQKAGKA